MRTLLPILMLGILLCGCQKMAPKAVVEEVQEPQLIAVVDDMPAWDACMQRCAQSDELGVRTRKGCLRGCDMARNELPFASKRFDDAQACIREVEAVDAEVHISGLKTMCKSEWKHLYKRKGCYDAVQAYYVRWSGKLCQLMTRDEQLKMLEFREKDTAIPPKTKK